MICSSTLLLAVFVAPPHGPASSPAAVVHSVAEVNDSRSHGAIGDGFLSLNEAIQLFNRTLTVALLSPAETAQLSGAGADISFARINAVFAPNITVEGDFDVLMNWAHGLTIEGYNGRVQLDFSGANVGHGFRSNCDSCNWRNLELVGGPYGIDLTQTDAAFGGTVVQNVIFSGQAQFGITVRAAQATGWGRLLVVDCVFVNMPTGIAFDETLADRTSVLGVLGTRCIGTSIAIDCQLGTGGQASYLFDRTSVQNSATGIRIQRPSGADRPVSLEATHVTVVAGDCLRYEGLAGAASDLQLRMLDLTANAGGTALNLGPLGSAIGGVLHECTMTGDVVVETGGAMDIDIRNARVGAGSVTFGTTSATPLSIVESRFDNCAVATSGPSQITFVDCCFLGGSLLGTAAAPVATSASFASAPVGSFVTQVGALPAAQLGSMRLGPALPPLGGSVTLTPDLPAGMLGFFVLGGAAAVSEPLPGVRTYFGVVAAKVVAFVQLQQPTVLAVPVNLALLGTEWVAQIAVVPGPGMQAPAMQAPPGGRFSF